MNFIFFLLPLFCSASLIPDLNVSKINTTSLISSLTDADPAAVIEVRDLIDDLIAAGETDRNTATTARDDAQGVKDAAGTALQDATDLHTETAGDLVSADEEEARLTLLEDEKRVAKELAQDAKDDADTALQTAQGHLDSETIRLDGEKETLERILELLDTLLGEWVTVAEESQGDNGNDNSDWQTLGWSNLPSFTSDGDYLVRMEWPNNFMEFTVPAGSDIFANSGDTAITGLTTSVTSPGYGGDAIFCHACMKNGGDKPGDTCWGVLPAGENNRQCGCNSGGWTGNGVYYGGYGSPTRCGGWSGGFAGAKTNGQQKGGIASPGLVLKIKAL